MLLTSHSVNRQDRSKPDILNAAVLVNADLVPTSPVINLKRALEPAKGFEVTPQN